MRRFSSIATAALFILLLGPGARAGMSNQSFRSVQAPGALTGLTPGPDFNGDGFADLAIGVPHDDTEVASDAGAVNVLYGGSVGLQVNLPVDQRWSQGSNQVKGTAEVGDLFGSALAAGDFNADGFSDLAIGVPGDSANDKADAGVVDVLYGSTKGLQAITPEDQLWTQESADVDDTAEVGDNFGGALASADFNGDNFADLAIGVPGEDIGTLNGAGAVAILYGGVDGLQATTPADQFWNQDSSNVRGHAEAGDKFGNSLTTGDFDDNGFADLAIGTPGEDSSSGGVGVFYGGGGGLQVTAPDDNFWTQDSAGVQDTAESGDQFGASVSAGDLDGNGFDDLAIGVPFENVRTVTDAGATAILYGKAGGIQADSPDDDYWTQNSSNVNGKSEKNDDFGSAVAVGDFNGDGFGDVAIGVKGEDIDTVTDSGAAAVLYGGSAGLQTSSPADQLWDQESPGVKAQADQGDLLGAAVAAADFDGSGTSDLAIGIPGEPAEGFDGAGGVSVLYSTSSGVQADAPDDDRWTQGSIGVEGDAGAGDSFGSSLEGAP